jgi:hypothetical protein
MVQKTGLDKQVKVVWQKGLFFLVTKDLLFTVELYEFILMAIKTTF